METQTSLDLKTGREQVLRIAAAFLILFLWRNFIYGVMYMFDATVPVLQGGQGHGLLYYNCINLAISLPLVALVFPSRFSARVISGDFFRPLLRSRWHFLFWSLAVSFAVQFFAFYMRKSRDPVHVLGFYWPNAIWPLMMIGTVFSLLPGAKRAGAPGDFPTRDEDFDLEAAVQRLRDEFAARTNLLPDERRELECHLRDNVAEYLRAGMSPDRAFDSAKRRLGQTAELGREFEKIDATRIARIRLTVVLGAFLGFYIWQDLVATPFAFAGRFGLPYFVVCYLPLLMLAMAAAQGAFTGTIRLWDVAIQNRWRFLFYSSIALVAAHGLREYRNIVVFRNSEGWNHMGVDWYIMITQSIPRFLTQFLLMDLWPWLLIALLFFLLPSAKTSTSSRVA